MSKTVVNWIITCNADIEFTTHIICIKSNLWLTLSDRYYQETFKKTFLTGLSSKCRYMYWFIKNDQKFFENGKGLTYLHKRSVSLNLSWYYWETFISRLAIRNSSKLVFIIFFPFARDGSSTKISSTERVQALKPQVRASTSMCS